MNITLSRRALNLLTVPPIQNLAYRSSSSNIKVPGYDIKTQEVECPRWLKTYNLRNKGEHIVALLKKYPKAKIVQKPDRIQISCLQKDLEIIKEISLYVKELIAAQSQVFVKINHSIRPAVMGINAAVIMKINADTGVHINFPKDIDQDVKITGLKDGVAKAKELLLERAERMTSKELEMNSSFYRYARVNIRKCLHNYPEVFVTFLNEPDSDKISISGPHEDVEQVSDLIMKQMDNIVGVELDIEHKYHGFLLGNKGYKIQKIRHKFPEVFELRFLKELDCNKVSISGPHEVVEQVSDLIMKQMENIGDVDLEIAKKYHGFLLGYKGERIKKIKLKFPEVFVTFPIEPGSNRVSIVGPHEDVELVSDLIMKQIKNIGDVDIEIPNKFQRSILGDKGNRIRKIGEQFPDVSFTFSKELDSDKVSISGPHEDVEQVSDLIKKQIECFVDVELEIEYKYHAFLLRDKGEKIQKITHKFPEVFVSMSMEPNRNKVSISGAHEDVEQVSDLIMKQLENIGDVDLEIANKYHGFLLGHKGETIKKIQLKFPEVFVTLPMEPGSNRVSIVGPHEDVELVSDLIMKQMENISDVDLEIPNKFHRFIVGEKGNRIRKIGEQFPDVAINFRSTATGRYFPYQDKISLWGHHEGVDKVADLIKQQIEGVVHVELDIPNEYHVYLIGHQAKIIKNIELKFPEVCVSFGLEPPHPDKVSIVGFPEDVEQVSDLIMKQMENIELDVELEIEDMYRKFLWRDHGKKIHEIARQFPEMFITFPKKNISDGSKVLLSGPREVVQQFSNLLNKLMDDIVDVELQIENKYHELLLGKKGGRIGKIMHTFPEVFVTFPKEHNKLSISGTRDDVEQFSNLIKKQMDDLVDVELEIENKYHGYLFRRNLERRILEFPEVFVSLPNEPDSDEVSISGPHEDVEQFSDLLKKRIEELGYRELEIRNMYHEFVLGYKANRIQEMKLKFPEVVVTLPEDSDKILIIGPHEDVEQVSDFLKKRIEESSYVELEINNKYHGFVMGHRAERREKIALNFPEVVVTLPKEPDKILIIGRHEDVEQVSDLLKKLIEEASYVELEIKRKYHGFLLGYKAKRIQEMILKFPEVFVTFPKESDMDSDKILIVGHHEDVEQVSGLIKKQIDDIFHAELLFSNIYKQFLLKNGGQNIKLKFPEVDIRFLINSKSECNKVSMCGSRDKVEECCDWIKDLADVEIEATSEYSVFLLGNKGKEINAIRDNYPEVSMGIFNTQTADKHMTPTSYMFYISGPRKNVEEVGDLLKKQQKERLFAIEDDGCSWEEAIAIDTYHFARLIGPNGSNIQTLQHPRASRHVNVNFNNELGNVVILGKKNDVSNMKEKLMALVQEESHVEEIHVPQNFINALIGKRGENCKRLRYEYNVFCDTPGAGEGDVKEYATMLIKGRKEQVDMAVRDVKQHIKRLEDNMMKSFL